MTVERDEGVWQRAEIESPCVKICVIHPEARICLGCHRTPEEIAAWGRMTPSDRRRIMEGLADRGGALRQRRGGRAARILRD